jgi:hypothetical protein
LSYIIIALGWVQLHIFMNADSKTRVLFHKKTLQDLIQTNLYS